jgi:hypothetical protein
MALLSFVESSTPSLQAQGEQRRSFFFNIPRDNSLAGLDIGESITIPSMLDEQAWTALEAARAEFVKAMMSGRVGVRYQS